MRFRAEQHLRRQLDFQHVRTHGRRHDCGAFMLWYARQAAPMTPAVPVSDASSDTAIPAGTTPAESAPRTGPRPKKSASVPLPARVGVVASKSAVGNAVQRARAKRRLREAFRQHQLRVPAGYDLLLVARGSLNRLEYREIERRFADACLKVFPSAKA
jgi:ribonuclease P protein component